MLPVQYHPSVFSVQGRPSLRFDDEPRPEMLYLLAASISDGLLLKIKSSLDLASSYYNGQKKKSGHESCSS